MTPILFLMAAATAWVAYMIVHTDGPYDIFHKMRMATKEHRWTKLTCIYCTATQVALLVLVASLSFVNYNNFFEWGLYWMATAGLAVVFVAVLGWLEAN